MITHHEAAHAVAAVMTADGSLGDQIEVTLIDRGTRREKGQGGASLLVPGHPMQAALIVYAGPWGEARAQWLTPLGSLNDTNEGGTPFYELVKDAFASASRPPGGEADARLYAMIASANPNVLAREQDWSIELERAWPVIQELADALRCRLDNADQVERGTPPIRHTLQTGAMAKEEIVHLVRPLLQTRGQWRHFA